MGITERARKMNAMARVAQPKPTRGSRAEKRIGKVIPAMGEPVDATPRARARCRRKYCERMAAEGRKVNLRGWCQ